MSEFQDQELECMEWIDEDIRCGRKFLFTAREQAFYADKGFAPPKRCRQCREARKARKAAQRDDFGNARDYVYSPPQDFDDRPDRRSGRRRGGPRKQRRRDEGERRAVSRVHDLYD